MEVLVQLDKRQNMLSPSKTTKSIRHPDTQGSTVEEQQRLIHSSTGWSGHTVVGGELMKETPAALFLQICSEQEFAHQPLSITVNVPYKSVYTSTRQL